MSVFLIAEVGVNHNGEIDLAKQLVVRAKESGAHAVKFQTFSAERLACHQTPKVKYQKRTTDQNESHLEMLKKLELSSSQHSELFEYCRKVGIEFLSTPYDVESVDMLEELGVKQYKIASADIVDTPLIDRIALTGKPVLLSVGMATLGEVEAALGRFPDSQLRQVTLLHCVSNYPCAEESLNLRVIDMLRAAFDVEVGFSDHSVGYEAAMLAVALGVSVIEKHFTLDKKLPGPDHAASSTPAEFEELAKAISRASIMLGSRRKRCQSEEREMAAVSRKSLTLVRTVEKGNCISAEDLRMMRPAGGLGAEQIDLVVGRQVRRTIDAFSKITWSDLE